ncbi:hypothetical protein B0H67DRAFT_557158 [Lasiosphaeris hirsuta]|uniref:Uncharacterized protein n=1 Tax=Lasiosphaeris hirsuta TaxID=260670 RepID=A0AA39ZVH3_9PEZI|nr:hypothetical protein B0H67DRAFT_557158 [Lasiosphaeris hirsuta]
MVPQPRDDMALVPLQSSSTTTTDDDDKASPTFHLSAPRPRLHSRLLAKSKQTLRRTQHPLSVLLPHLHLPLAILAGCALTGGTTYLVARHIVERRAAASVDPDPATWIALARRVYDACYLGCEGCVDVGYAWEACARTAEMAAVASAGGEGGMGGCDARSMWSWKERYPLRCLEGVGGVFKARALERERDKVYVRLLLVFLTVLAGVSGGWGVFWGWGRLTRGCAARVEEWRREEEERREARERMAWPGLVGLPHRSEGRRSGKAPWVVRLLALLGLGLPASAWPCAVGTPYTAYFADAGRNVTGVIYGGLGRCYCQEHFYLETVTENHGKTSYAIRYYYTTEISAMPVDLVEDMLPRVEQCGFSVLAPTKKCRHPSG